MTDPNFATRVVLVSGEMTSPGMGFSEVDLETLRKNVSVVIHSAASVNFMEKIRFETLTHLQRGF
jgi:fatty acyl-CoA reductase